MAILPRQDQIVVDIRDRILGGTFEPGRRLPTRTELVESFDASSVTVQRALDRLADDGFIEARGRQGTFVADHPPHLFHFGLVLANRRPAGPWFWKVLVDEAQRIFGAGPRRFTVYEGIAERDATDFPRLLRDVEESRLAGLVFASNPSWIAGTPILTTPGLPRVMIGDPCGSEIPGVVEPVASDFLDLALDHLLARNRRRVALIGVPGMPAGDLDRFVNGVARRGMATARPWQQAMVITYPQWADNLAMLLMTRPAEGERPDALVVTDDNLVGPIMHGLVAAGVRIPEDLEVVAHANFPQPSPSPAAITRLGFDVHALLAQCIADLDHQRRTGVADTHALIRPVFERDASPLPPVSPHI